MSKDRRYTCPGKNPVRVTKTPGIQGISNPPIWKKYSAT
jgi:hypothetical protein